MGRLFSLPHRGHLATEPASFGATFFWEGGSNVSSTSRVGGRTCTHPAVDKEGPRDGDALLLPSAQAHALLATKRRVPIGQGLDGPIGRRWKMTMDKISTFTPPSSAAPDTSCATSCATSFTSRPSRVAQGHIGQTSRPQPPTPKRAEVVFFIISRTDFQRL